MKLTTVFVVRGDFGNVGSVRHAKVLGIFENESLAKEAAKGCGSYDMGGDGYVHIQWAVEIDTNPKNYLLLEEDHDGHLTYFNMNEMGESEVKKIYESLPEFKEEKFVHDCQKLIFNGERIKAVKLYRTFHVNSTLKEAVEFVDSLINKISPHF